MTQDALIELSNLSKVFYTEELETWALNEIHLDIRRGEYVAISGPSGCGKSTLLSLIGLLDTCTSGSYRLAGQDVAGLGSSERAGIRNREIGFVFQAFNLIGEMTVYENVELPLTYRSGLSGRARRRRVEESLDWVDMPHRSRHFPAQLSGGQQQRVAIARALAGQPSVLLADEPTGNLDSKNASVVMELLDQLHARGSTICIVTHDAASASRAQRQVVLHDGRVVDDQTTESALRNRNAEIAP
ncbi:MAG: ABC transporter ATP-binding protein [Haliea sp.]|nr:ABC transporter ATP-binding protein [Haliea sp.]